MNEISRLSRLSILFVSFALISAPVAGEPPKRTNDETTYSTTITSLPVQPGYDTGQPRNGGIVCEAGAGQIQFCLARAARGDRIEISMIAERWVTEEIIEEGPTLASTGVKQPTRRVQTRPVTETYTQQLRASAVTCRRVDGKEVPTKTMLQELASERPAIFSPDGKMIDPRFAKMFQPTTLVLSFRSSTSAPEAPTFAPQTIVPVPAYPPTKRPLSNAGSKRSSRPAFQPRTASGAIPRR
jgi:hypothetical protein